MIDLITIAIHRGANNYYTQVKKMLIQAYISCYLTPFPSWFQSSRLCVLSSCCIICWFCVLTSVHCLRHLSSCQYNFVGRLGAGYLLSSPQNRNPWRRPKTTESEIICILQTDSLNYYCTPALSKI